VVGRFDLQRKDVTGLWASSAPESLHASGAEAAIIGDVSRTFVAIKGC